VPVPPARTGPAPASRWRTRPFPPSRWRSCRLCVRGRRRRDAEGQRTRGQRTRGQRTRATGTGVHVAHMRAPPVPRA
jgi:hypothetical protein